MHTRLRRRTLQRGFTLIEILTVLAIIGILTAILVPAVSKAMQRSRLTSVVAEIRSLKTLVAEATNRLNGSLPITEGQIGSPGGYLNTATIWFDADGRPNPPGPPYTQANWDLLVELDRIRGKKYGRLVRLDHVLTSLSPPLMDSPWSTRFGGVATPSRMVQPPIKYNERNRVFERTDLISPRTIYNFDGANEPDDSSAYSRIESAKIVRTGPIDRGVYDMAFDITAAITNPNRANVNEVGGIGFDLDGNAAADQLGRQCVYVIYKSVPVVQAFSLAREFNAAGLMDDTAPGGNASQTRGSVIYGPPVGGAVDVYVHLVTL